MSKQDRQAVRTAAGLEQKYRFGKSFSEQKAALNRQNLTLSQLANYTEKSLDSFGTGLESTEKAIAELRAEMANMWGTMWEKVYPIGTIYVAYNHEDPATLFGGTWVRIENAFLWATDTSGEIGKTGGEATVTLTVDEIPSHSHNVGLETGKLQQGTHYSRVTAAGGSTSVVSSTGGGKAHNNMPPYIQVSAWRRTA